VARITSNSFNVCCTYGAILYDRVWLEAHGDTPKPSQTDGESGLEPYVSASKSRKWSLGESNP
jgi:hypothetical protein